jgi:hypothetical protein
LFTSPDIFRKESIPVTYRQHVDKGKEKGTPTERLYKDVQRSKKR